MFRGFLPAIFACIVVVLWARFLLAKGTAKERMQEAKEKYNIINNTPLDEEAARILDKGEYKGSYLRGLDIKIKSRYFP